MNILSLSTNYYPLLLLDIRQAHDQFVALALGCAHGRRLDDCGAAASRHGAGSGICLARCKSTCLYLQSYTSSTTPQFTYLLLDLNPPIMTTTDPPVARGLIHPCAHALVSVSTPSSLEFGGNSSQTTTCPPSRLVASPCER